VLFACSFLGHKFQENRFWWTLNIDLPSITDVTTTFQALRFSVLYVVEEVTMLLCINQLWCIIWAWTHPWSANNSISGLTYLRSEEIRRTRSLNDNWKESQQYL
jgi:hypothetical protein